MGKVSNLLGKAIAACLCAALFILVAVTFFQVLCRFVLKIPIAWSEEVARMSFAWLIFLGAAIAVKEGTHLMLDMVTGMFGPRLRYVFQVVVLFMILIIAAIIMFAGASYCLRAVGKTAVSLPIPANCVYAAVPLSAALMVFFAIEKIVGKLPGRGEAGI